MSPVDRLLPIIEGLQARDDSLPLSLPDFLGIDDPANRFHELRGLFWVQALKDAATDANFAGLVADLWETFGELLPIGFDHEDGPLFVAKIGASPEHIGMALAYISSPTPGEVLQ
ncbi:MAG: hypothetical protein E5Y12_25455 [Mesorhizobium sp.]|nr:MAG: hypothetical protein E5Y12_25455 [Mesorhizobium sp.]